MVEERGYVTLLLGSRGKVRLWGEIPGRLCMSSVDLASSQYRKSTP